MELSSEANVRKILLDFKEYERLKHIESQYIELHRVQKVQSDQIGKGIEKDDDNTSSIIPPVTTQDEKAYTQLPPPHFDVNILKNDLSDIYDEKKLLHSIPKTQLENAKKLLEEFNKRGDELTWNSSGTIFINQTALPSSNIFALFPLLFKKKVSKEDGFIDFLQKINDMGLSDLILVKAPLDSYETNEIIVGEGLEIKSNKSETEISIPWWYIGD